MSEVMGSIVGAVGNYLTAQQTSDANQSINKKNIAWQAQSQVQNQKWQEYMRSTAYQATMADMKAAGLNPMLAFSRGPTSWGSASAAPGSSLGAVAPDIAGGLERGVRAVTTARAAPLERTLLEQQAREVASRADANEAQAAQTREVTRMYPAMTAAQIAGQYGIAAGGQGTGAQAQENARILRNQGPSGPFWNPQVWSGLASRAASWLGGVLNSAVEANRALGPPGGPYRQPGPTPSTGRTVPFTIGPDAPRR